MRSAAALPITVSLPSPASIRKAPTNVVAEKSRLLARQSLSSRTSAATVLPSLSSVCVAFTIRSMPLAGPNSHRPRSTGRSPQARMVSTPLLPESAKVS